MYYLFLKNQYLFLRIGHNFSAIIIRILLEWQRHKSHALFPVRFLCRPRHVKIPGPGVLIVIFHEALQASYTDGQGEETEDADGYTWYLITIGE